MSSGIPAREVPFPTSFVLGESAASTTGIEEAGDPPLDVDQIQGNILAGFNKDNQTLIFLKINEVTTFKLWLCAIIPFVATTQEVLQFNRLFKMIRSRRKVESRTVLSTWLNVAFSFKGLKKLDQRETDKFRDEAFRKGLAARSRDLNDPLTGEGAPESWLVGGPNNEADVLFILASDSIEEMALAVRRVENWVYEGAQLHGRIVPSGASVIFKQKGATLPSPLTGHEHFGFLDGVSQPGIRGTIGKTADLITPRQNPADPSQGKPGQDCLWPGEFVFGYPAQNPKDADKKGEEKTEGPSWSSNGSFLVFRRLRQDVDGFHQFLKSVGDHLKLGPDLFGAKCVGRWASGAPIERAPTADNPQMSRDDCANNAFDFQKATARPPAPSPGQCADQFPKSLAAEDSQGLVCPFAGHIRKAYPRDDVSRDPKTTPVPNEADTETHRLLRRGIPFGDPFDPTVIPDDGNRGLLFLAYQTSIENQFEFITKNWVNNADFKDQGSGHDPILGQSNQKSRERFFTVRDADGNQQTIKLEKDWVTPTGGGYFFSPSIRALNELSRGPEE